MLFALLFMLLFVVCFSCFVLLGNWTLSVRRLAHLCNGQWENTHLSYDSVRGNYASFETMFRFFIQNENRSEKINTFSFVSWFSHSMPFVVRPLLDNALALWNRSLLLRGCVLIYCGIFEWMECEQQKSTLKRSSSVCIQYAVIDQLIRTRARFLARLECANCVFQCEIPFHKPHSVTTIPLYF